MFTGPTPDITPAQIAAAVAWVVGQLVSYGLLDTRFSQIVLSAGTTLATLGWFWADSHIRHGRATGTKPVSGASGV